MNITITEDKKLIVEMKHQLIKAIASFQSWWDTINVNKVVTSSTQKNITC